MVIWNLYRSVGKVVLDCDNTTIVLQTTKTDRTLRFSNAKLNSQFKSRLMKIEFCGKYFTL